MTTPLVGEKVYRKKTILTLLVNGLFNEPLFCLYGLTAFILRKSLGASAFQISLLMMLRPVVSILSFYWSSSLSDKNKRLKANVIGAGFLSCFFFLFFPWIQNIWFVIFGAALYILFQRAGLPAWVEILKLNLAKKTREKTFSLGSALNYVEGILLTIGMGAVLDHNELGWQGLFFAAASLGMINLFFLSKVPVNYPVENIEKKRVSWKEKIVRPWRESFELMRSRGDFAHFQIGFFLCGFGIMMIQPVVPFFLADYLHLRYMDIAIALSICKGLGFALSSPIWARGLNRLSIQKLSSIVFVCVGLFPLFLVFASSSFLWIYLAYFLYGIGQGGSHLIWNLSGPIFSGEEKSVRFSGVNVVMVGIRGAIAIPIGGALFFLFGPMGVFLLGAGLCFYGGMHMVRKKLVAFE